MDRRDVGYLLALAGLVFLAEAALAREWFRLGVFSQYNVIFDDDPNTWLQRFANGRRVGGFTHPLLATYFTPFLRIASRAGAVLRLVPDQEAFRLAAALYIAPACAAVKTACLFVIFRLLTLDRPRAAVAAALSAVAFSSVVFGATPTHYAVTGCLLTVLSVLPLLAWEQVGRGVRVAVGIVVSVLAIGTTSSNVIHVGSVSFSTGVARHGRFARALGVAMLYGAMTLVLTVAASGLLLKVQFLHGAKLEGDVADAVERNVGQYTPSRTQQVLKLAAFPVLLGRAFVATTPLEKPNALAVTHGNPIPFELTYEGAEMSWFEVGLGLLTAAAVGAGAWCALRAGGRWRAMSLGWVMSLGAFGALYSLYGFNSFLYSQHWQVPASLLIGALFIPGRNPGARRVVAGVAVAAVLLVADTTVVSHVTERIRAVAPGGGS